MIAIRLSRIYETRLFQLRVDMANRQVYPKSDADLNWLALLGRTRHVTISAFEDLGFAPLVLQSLPSKPFPASSSNRLQVQLTLHDGQDLRAFDLYEAE